MSAYTKSKSPLRLEDAVDELRRLVLASNGRKVTRTDLLRSYDWLSVSSSAIADLDQMYKRAYGGLEGFGAISGMNTKAPMRAPRPVPPRKPQTVHEPIIRSDDDTDNETGMHPDLIGVAVSSAELVLQKPLPVSKPPSPKGPVLKLQTNFDPPKAKAQKPVSKFDDEDDDDNSEEDGDRTARPTDVPIVLQAWNAISIDEVLTAGVMSPDRSSMKLGPMTPNGYDDISPTTRGEWGFLMVDDAFQSAKTVAVETC